MTKAEVLQRLEAEGSNPTETSYGTLRGKVRALAKEIKRDHELALQLWESDKEEPQMVAVLIFDNKQLEADQLVEMINGLVSTGPASWLVTYVLKKRKDRVEMFKTLREQESPLAAHTGWTLGAQLATKDELEDPDALLDTIEAEMADAPEDKKWAMNYCLCMIGIHDEARRERAISIGEAIGAYIDYPTSKGCTTPYAPEAIRQLSERAA